MRRGRDFVVTIERAWQAANCLTPKRRKALAAHRDRFRRGRRGAPRPPEPGKPGSYNWKFLRDQLERRAAAGEAVMSIIRDLRERHQHDVADMPSISTMRRWYRQARAGSRAYARRSGPDSSAATSHMRAAPSARTSTSPTDEERRSEAAAADAPAGTPGRRRVGGAT